MSLWVDYNLKEGKKKAVVFIMHEGGLKRIFLTFENFVLILLFGFVCFNLENSRNHQLVSHCFF